MEAKPGCGWFGLLLVLLLSVALVGCNEIGIPVDTPAPPSGIRGLVTLSPTCPVVASPGANEPDPCVTPYSARLVVLDGEGVVVARVTSSPDGRFSVDLAPGEYVLTPETGTDSYPIAQPQSVVVTPGQYVEVGINYDTGIR